MCDSKEEMAHHSNQPTNRISRLWRLRAGRMPLGHGLLLGRLALNEMSVEHMVLYRFLFASLGMLPVALANRGRGLTPRAKPALLLISAFFGVPIQFLLQFHGLALTTVSHAALMVGAMPVLLAVAAALFAGERLDWIGWLALVGSTIGAALIVLGGHHGHAGTRRALARRRSAGGRLALTALAWILLSKKLMQTHSPPVVTAYTILSGTAMLLIWSWAHGCSIPCWRPSRIVRPPPVRPRQRHRVDRARHQRPVLHRDHHPFVELGHSPRPRVARRRLPEH